MQFLEIPCPKSKYDSHFIHSHYSGVIESLEESFPEVVREKGLRFLYPHLRNYRSEIAQDSLGSNYRKLMVNTVLLELIYLLMRKETEIEVIRFLAHISSFQEGVVFSLADKEKLQLMYDIDERVHAERWG